MNHISNGVHHMVATMTWLTVTEYLLHKWPRICCTCRNISRTFHDYHRICN